jgi:thiamine transporter ThiT
MVLGILAAIGMIVGFVPCFGWVNWINIPFGMVALVIGIIGLSRPDPNKTGSIVGTACGALAVVLGFVRLVLGAGLL